VKQLNAIRHLILVEGNYVGALSSVITVRIHLILSFAFQQRNRFDQKKKADITHHYLECIITSKGDEFSSGRI
jgi:hypothetical protein